MKEYRKIKSLKYLYEITKDGEVRNTKSKKVMKPELDKDGYYRIRFNNKLLDNGTCKRFLHQLVMEAWGPEKPEWATSIDHIDRDRLNNDISNLRWANAKIQAENREFKPEDVTKRLETMWKFTRETASTQVSNGFQVFKNSYEAARYIKDSQNLESRVQTIACHIKRCADGERKEAYKYKWKKI